MKCPTCHGYGFAGADQMLPGFNPHEATPDGKRNYRGQSWSVGDRYPDEFIPLRACSDCGGRGEVPDASDDRLAA